jgi:hypothetical protein
MKLARKALRKVEREGDPSARCQYDTNRARGRAWRVKRAEGGETIGGATGTVRVQRSGLTGLEPVRKGKTAEGESKNCTEVLVKTANPLGRMRGETQNSECDRADVGRKETDTGDSLWGKVRVPVM